MIKKLTLLVGIGAGYVLGAKAGHERYDQIKSGFSDLRGNPRVQQATEAVQSTAQDLAERAKESVTDKVDTLTSKNVDLTEVAGSPPAATYSTP